MPKVLKSRAREMVLHVRSCCEEERDNDGPTVSFNLVRSRVAYLTGISERTVTRITNEGKKAESSSQKIVTPGKKRSRDRFINIDDFDYCAIRHKINEFYVVKKEIPTINKLWLELKSDINFTYGRITLKSVLKKLGYKFHKCQSKRKVFMERPDIAAWRAKYILRLRKNRSVDKRPKVYLDETYIHASYHLQKCWQGPEQDGILASESVGVRWIIDHAGSKQGFVPNGLLIFKSKTKSSDYRDDMDADNFLRRMSEMIIPNLEPNSLVIMDNASYHCTQTDKAPSMSNLKADLQTWLREKGIFFEENWTKPQLFQLVKENKGPPVHKVDELLKQNGYRVERLPPYHCDLNPIEKIWAIMKRKVAEKNVSQSANHIEDLTRNALSLITPEEWSNVCEYVEKIEDQYYTSDQLMDLELDKFIISVTSDSDTDSDSSDSEEESSEGISGIRPLNPLIDHNYFKQF